MTRFYARGGRFWLDDKPMLIQAGEFHYFRTPKGAWAHRLGLLKGAGFNAVASYIPWLWHQPEEGLLDLDGHSHPMRDLAGFLDMAADMGLYIIARPGPYIMAETINEGIPPWVFRKYPGVAFVSQDGKTQNVVSYLHPDFLACVSGWYKAVFGVLAPRQITRGGKIILVQLDNEMGMIQWVRNILDINPDTLTRFAAYLARTYGDRLRDRYPADPLSDFLRDGLVNPHPPYAADLVEDYRRFYREYLREYADFLLAQANACGLEVPPVINIHGFANGGKTFPIGLSQLVAVMEMDDILSATDVYPGHIDEGNFHQLLLVNEMTKALHNREQPLFSIEFQAGGNQDFSGAQASLYDLHTRLCISCGMRAVNHYLFFDGENDPILSPIKRHDWGHPVRKDGSLRKHYFRYPGLSRALNAYGQDLVASTPQTVTTIGFLLDYFMTEVNNEYTREFTNIITHQRDAILFDMIARGLALTHRPFNAVDLDRCDLDASRIPLCWVMIDRQCSAETQQKLVDYVRQGGKLVLVGRMCREDFQHEACTILRGAIGIKGVDGGAPFATSLINAFGHIEVPASFVETYSGDFDEIVATREDGAVVGFVNRVGAGEVLVFGAAAPAYTLEELDIVHQMGMRMGCPPLFKPSDWADVRISHHANGSFLFVNNYQDDPVEITIQHEGSVLFGGNAVALPARRGLILPLEWQPKPGITIHYLTAEIVEIADEGERTVIKTAQDAFFAEISLVGYRCTRPGVAGAGRIALRGTEGLIELTRTP